MRQLLLTALGAAGSLLMDLPALAQLSNTTSTFSGQIAASCSINLPENISLGFQPNNSLTISRDIEVTANFQIQLSIDQLTVVNEPQPEGQTIRATVSIWQVSGNMITLTQASKTESSGVQSFFVPANDPTNLNLAASVTTASMDEFDKYLLPDGRYTYRTTISCLQ